MNFGAMEGIKKLGEEIINKIEGRREGLLDKPLEGSKEDGKIVGEWAKEVKIPEKFKIENPNEICAKDNYKIEIDKKIGDWAKPIKDKLEQTTTNDVQENNNDVKSMQTKNQNLEGKKHPETGVPFVRKEVENSEGEKVEVVVPEFESVFDVQLPEELLEATDNEQFAECNKKLKEAIEKDPNLMDKFTDEQFAQILDDETPDGYTWHHDAEKGKMQLVDSKTHAKTGHTGGKAIWGGGKENR